MLGLDRSIRAFAIDMRGFGESETLPVDATRRVRDFSDDRASVLDSLGVTRASFVGWSMGGGGANPDFVAQLAAGNAGDDSPTSPRLVFRTAYVADPTAHSELEDLWVEAMLTTATGTVNYPGDSVSVEAWPGFGPGGRGVLNTMTPNHFNVSGITELASKPRILWGRGVSDAIVSDASGFDLNFLRQLGVIPGWPGADVAPPQPMIEQTRAVLDTYAANGGAYTELGWENCGHSAHLERPEEFVAVLTAHLTDG